MAGETPIGQVPYAEPGDAITVYPALSRELAELVDVLIPPGSIFPYADDGAAPIGGWLVCDGAAVSRVTYARLFALIGTIWGAGDGSTTFNVPDLRGRVLVGKGSKALIDTVGETDGRSFANRSISHRHTFSMGNTENSMASGGVSVHRNPTGQVTSGDADNTDYPAFAVVQYIVKV